MKSLLKRVSRVFGPKREHEAEVLDLRGVVVAGNIDEVYKVEKKLGEGQTANVYLGERLADGKKYALKCFKLTDGGHQAACEGLRDEVIILRSQPDHIGLCRMLEIVSTPGYVYLAMELVAGGDLLSPIEESGAYTEKVAQILFAQMVDAVDNMHRAGIVHRDLKPENVCFTDSRRRKLKIIDMGAAGFLTEHGLSDLCGTPLYAAPEVTPWYFMKEGGAKPRPYDERVDLWSMGIALYVMLSGSAPFNQEQETDALLRDVCKGKLGACPTPRALLFFEANRFRTPTRSVGRLRPRPLLPHSFTPPADRSSILLDVCPACRHVNARLAPDL